MGEQYADRDLLAMAGLYAKHVNAMTVEGLHDKSDIAAELAWRDQQIATLAAQVEALAEALRECRPFVSRDATDEHALGWVAIDLTRRIDHLANREAAP